MSFKKITLHCVAATYFIISLAGFIFTLVQYPVPFVPFPLIHFSYGMMAPYQGYITHDWELVAEGETENGEWELIDLNSYLPFQRGEKIMRGGLVTFRAESEELLQEQYTKLAAQLLELETEKGNMYQRIRLSIHSWPASKEGYEALRVPGSTTITPILTHP